MNLSYWFFFSFFYIPSSSLVRSASCCCCCCCSCCCCCCLSHGKVMKGGTSCVLMCFFGSAMETPKPNNPFDVIPLQYTCCSHMFKTWHQLNGTTLILKFCDCRPCNWKLQSPTLSTSQPAAAKLPSTYVQFDPFEDIPSETCSFLSLKPKGFTSVVIENKSLLKEIPFSWTL